MKSFKGISYALISSGTFGLIPLFSIPLLGEGMSQASVLFYRFLISAILMGSICLLRKKDFRIDRKHMLPVVVLSLFYASTSLLLLFSYSYIPSGISTTIHFLYPILVSIIMVAFFKEKKSTILFLAAALSVIGVLVLCWTDAANVKFAGVLIAAATIITYSTYIVGLNQTSASKIDAEVLTFYVLFLGACLFFIFALATTGIGTIPSFPAFGRLFLLALLPTVVSDLTLILAVKNIGSTVTSILGSMEPVVAVLVGVFYFSEHFDIVSLAGITLIITSVIMVVVRSSKKKELEPIPQLVKHHNTDERHKHDF
ncbi:MULTISPECIES: DMT family transporter [unclassified Dysgonomonas]|uniref:EamA family transporter n=1 Tax=unclassified Dysgonomonas TaxID=2630389 RepID=UPI0024762A47|nr:MULTISPECIES: DMT family transporter [unclassified Dysgonomonas]